MVRSSGFRAGPCFSICAGAGQSCPSTCCSWVRSWVRVVEHEPPACPAAHECCAKSRQQRRQELARPEQDEPARARRWRPTSSPPGLRACRMMPLTQIQSSPADDDPRYRQGGEAIVLVDAVGIVWAMGWRSC